MFIKFEFMFLTDSFVFIIRIGYRNNVTPVDNSMLCKTTLFFPEKYQNFNNDKLQVQYRKTQREFGKCFLS